MADVTESSTSGMYNARCRIASGATKMTRRKNRFAKLCGVVAIMVVRGKKRRRGVTNRDCLSEIPKPWRRLVTARKGRRSDARSGVKKISRMVIGIWDMREDIDDNVLA